MAYNELIKNFGRIREYMREFYIYGFKSRDEYNEKSARSYDDERRRIESWLGDYMKFRRTHEGKIVFLSIDSRAVSHNPLYRALKSKSFTDGDITLHFILMDILHSHGVKLSLSGIIGLIDEEYLSCFRSPMVFDESTIRKKLREYINEGIVTAEKQGRKLLYSRSSDVDISELADVLDYFSEIVPCGVIGSFMLDKLPMHDSKFTFKHHYISHALDSGILCRLFHAIRNRQLTDIERSGRNRNTLRRSNYVPLYIYISAQNGRQHLLAYDTCLKRFASLRVDYITAVDECGEYEGFDELRSELDEIRAHMWGAACPGRKRRTEHIEFTLRIEPDEEHIYSRLLREKRCGTVERISETSIRFSADVYDTNEMIPWIRTFICRITSLKFSNRTAENRFKKDIEKMYRLYGIDGGDDA